MFKRLQKLFGFYKIKNLNVVIYRSYGTAFHLYIKGRVLDNLEIQFKEKSNFFQTLLKTIQQFDTYEISNVSIELNIGGIILKQQSDHKGYFTFDEILPIDISMLADSEGWVTFDISTMESASIPHLNFKGSFLIPDQEADFAIISDIDDTILNTGVTSFLKWRLIKNSIFVNTYNRTPLLGAAELYQKLHLGVDKKEKNPIFYLSNSPWNLYQYLKVFLDYNDFPKGAILLRTFNSMFQRLMQDEKPHKQKEIVNLLKTYPDLKFILIGDSGEHDASIYTEIAAQFPHQILCIYLRTVRHKKRMLHVKSIVDNFKTTPVLMVENSVDAENHARSNGYI